jgi:hypothetical protein
MGIGCGLMNETKNCIIKIMMRITSLKSIAIETTPFTILDYTTVSRIISI